MVQTNGEESKCKDCLMWFPNEHLIEGYCIECYEKRFTKEKPESVEFVCMTKGTFCNVTSKIAKNLIPHERYRPTCPKCQKNMYKISTI